MNKTLTNILRDVILLGIGAATGALVTNKIVAKKYETLANQAIAEQDAKTKDWYANRLESIKGEYEAEIEVLKNPELAAKKAKEKSKQERKEKREEVKKQREYKNLTHDYTSYHKKPDLAGLASKYEDETNNYDFKKDEKTGVYNLDTSKAPYQISQEEFFNDHQEYDKVTVEYWEEDDIYSDSNDERIHEIGFDVRNFKDVSLAQASTIFVRNDAMKMDYEMIINTGSYYRDVLGYDDDNVDDRPAKKVKTTEE